MKKCPFCAEDIQDEAIKCRFCGEFLNSARPPESGGLAAPAWYFKTSFIVIAFFCVGPLALPLIWWHPEMKRTWKIGITLATVILSWFLFQATLESFRVLQEYLKLLEGM